MKYKYLIILNIIFFACLSCEEPLKEIPLEIDSRPFYMGFTNWPPEATVEGITEMNQFIEDYGDLFAYQIDNGVPWPEALAGTDFSSNLMENWESTRGDIPSGHALFVSINPLDDSRVNMAKYWGEEEGMDLPPPWDTLSLSHEDVKTAYLNYARRVIEFFEPEYLAIGIEVNVSMIDSLHVWEAYKELHEYVYTELKKIYPSLPIFATFTHAHMKGMEEADELFQQQEISALLEYCDLLGLSTYPYGWSYWQSGKMELVPENYFDLPVSFGKTIAITETGAPSRDFEALGINYEFTEDYQYDYIDLLLRKAYEHEFAFVVNWTSIDFDKLLKDIPEEGREIALIWAYTGLQMSDGTPKEALTIWDAYLQLPYAR
jgi:hypothetical protein